MISNFTKIPLAALYRVGYLWHHKFFLKKGEPLKHAQVVIIGGFRIGGAGKTPFCIWMAKELCTKGKKVAILCHSAAQDESLLLKKSLPSCTIIATTNRYKTALEIDNSFDIIICDDGFEDSRLQFADAICLEWEREPRKISDIFPAGSARSYPKDHPNIKIRLNCHGNTPDIRFSIQEIRNMHGKAPKNGNTEIVLVAGIGDPDRFFKDIESTGLSAHKKVRLRDHSKNIERTTACFLDQGEQVIITEKDSCRIGPEILAHENLFIAKQSTLVPPKTRAKILSLFE